MRDNIRWASAGLGAVCVAGLLGLLQVQPLTSSLRVACFGFSIGLAAALAMLALWEHAENNSSDAEGSSGGPELLVAGLATLVGIGGVVAHLEPVAAVAGGGALITFTLYDAVLIVLRRRRGSSA